MVARRGFPNAGAASVAALIGAGSAAALFTRGDVQPEPLAVTLPGFGVEHRRLPGLFVADPLLASVDPSLWIIAWSYVAARAVEASLG